MRILIWVITALVTIMGTLLVAVMAFTAGWLGDNMSGGADWVKQLAQVPVPTWLSLYLDPAMIAWVRTMSVDMLGAAATGLPWLAPMLGWVAPVLWAVWLIVLLVLLLVAVGLHYALGRRRTRS